MTRLAAVRQGAALVLREGDCEEQEIQGHRDDRGLCAVGAVWLLRQDFHFTRVLLRSSAGFFLLQKLTIRYGLGIFGGSVKIVYSQVHVKKSLYVGVCAG